MTDNTVTFELSGETVELKPTYGAATRIPKHFGGYMPAIDAISKLDPAAMETIIAYGMDLTPAGQKKLDLPRKIYESGYPKVAAPCIEFLTILMNGGKRPEDVEEAKSAEGEA